MSASLFKMFQIAEESVSLDRAHTFSEGFRFPKDLHTQGMIGTFWKTRVLHDAGFNRLSPFLENLSADKTTKKS